MTKFLGWLGGVLLVAILTTIALGVTFGQSSLLLLGVGGVRAQSTGPTVQTTYYTSGTGSGRALGTVYQNTLSTALWVQVSILATATNNGCIAQTDSSSTPSTHVADFVIDSGANASGSVFFPVLAGNYYKVSCGGTGGGSLFDWTEWH